MAVRIPWKPDPNRVMVVPGGRGAREQAWRFQIYHCQNRRSFQDCQWIAFYCDGEIDTMAEIVSAPEDDVVMDTQPELADVAAHTKLNNGDPSEPHTLLRLKGVTRIGPVKNNAASSADRGVAYARNYRYADISTLRSARFTSELG